MRVSIVIPTWNGEDEIGECLEGIFSQEVDFDFDVLLVDSSSTDRTLDIAARYPVRVHRIPQAEFSHGDTRNLGAMMTEGELIVFLVQDAYPERRDWLRQLTSNLDDPMVAGAYSRVIPRPDAGPLVRRGVQGDLNFRNERIVQQIVDEAAYRAMDPLAKRIFINFNDVASCLRRSVWETLPYARVEFGEDMLWSKAALEAGHSIVFDPAAPVVHSHEYDASTLRARTRIDGWVNRAYLDRINIVRRKDVWTMTRRVAKDDRAYLREQGFTGWRFWRQALLSYWYHYLEFLGAYEGGQTQDRLRAPEAVEQRLFKILFVVHGFPPETFAGTEVLTLSLAKALQARGHEVLVFHRVADTSLKTFEMVESEYDGLKVIRIANHLDYGSIRHTFHSRPIEDAFREVLQRERPDVVHFEHLIHLSAALPRICRQAGVPSVLTLNDFWYRCPMVQLIRPNERVCSGKPPILGCAACVVKMPRLIPVMRFLSRPFQRMLAGLARRYIDFIGTPAMWTTQVLADLAWLSMRPPTMVAEMLQADFIIAPSPFLRSKMVEAGVPQERLIVSDYGMETDWLDQYRRTLPNGKVRFGFIGSLVWYKGLEVLARAFQRIGDARAELHIHGDTEGLEVFRQTRVRIEAHVTRPGLEFHGRYAPEDLGRVLGAIDVLVVPSIWYENSPLAIHEAFQAGIPVLVSDRGGMKDLVEEGRGGLRFRPGDDQDLARVMQRFLDEEELAGRVVEARPRVKTVTENAFEMEIKYRQAIGLMKGRSTVEEIQLIPPIGQHGAVELDRQRGSVLLKEDDEAGSWVAYEFVADGDFSADLSLVALHEADETDVELGGEVRLDRRGALRIEPTPGEAEQKISEFVAPVFVRKGKHRLVVENRLPGEGKYRLRFERLALYRTGAPRGE